MSPSEAMPITTVTKITGAVTVLMSCRNASASHFASVAGPGATRPNSDAGGDRHEHPEPQLRASWEGRLLSSLSDPAALCREEGEATSGARAAVALVVVLVEESLWSRENMRPMRVKSLAGRLLILQLTVVAVTVAAGALITVLVARERTETAAARSLADDRAHRRRAAGPRARAAAPATRRARCSRSPSGCARSPRVGFITIMRPDGIRYTHPNPRLIGQHFVGTYAPAARGGTVTETTKGTLGQSVRAVVPVARGRAGRRARRRRRAHRRDRRGGRRAAARPARPRGGRAR